MSEKRHIGIVYILFFFSGFTGLVYEILWTRMFALVFGATTFAISIVLAAFMGGFALGSFLFGRFVDKRGDPLRIYAFLEILLGIYALILPFLISALKVAYSAQHQFLTANMVKFALSFVMLIIPTTLMGGTLPVLSKFVMTPGGRLGLNIGGLYSVNTIGGALGCFMVGFVFIASMGINATIYLTAGLNFAIGLIALILKTGRSEVKDISSEDIDLLHEPSTEHNTFKTNLVIVVFGLSGFAALAYEVLWTRVLSMVIGATVYAFSIMLTAFLCGLALGSFLSGIIADRIRRLTLVFSIFQMTIGIFGVVSIFVLGSMPLIVVNMFREIGNSWQGFIFVKLVVAFALMLIPTSLMGAMFPLASRICAGSIRFLGRSIGNIYSVNTLGSILGSLAAGFILIPAIGLQKSIIFAASVNMLNGLAVLIGSQKQNLLRFAFGVVILPIFVVLALFSSWNRKILAEGVYFEPWQYSNRAGKVDIKAKAQESQMLYYGEGIDSTVAVFMRGPDLTLKINGKPVASTTLGDIRLLGMMGYLPTILHGSPQRALVIGLGAGVTAGMAAQYESVDRVYCVELERKVAEAAEYFTFVNHDVLNDPKFNLIIGDGRNSLLTADKKYDVITSDPIHPWVSGAGSLYALDHFRLCKERLNEGGVVAQWLPLYEMPERDFRMIIKTFQSVFPHTTLWLTDSDSILIGTLEELHIDYMSLVEKFQLEVIERDMRMLYLDTVFDFLSCFMMDEEALADYSADAEVNTDDHPLLEFSAPKGLYSETVSGNLETIRQRMKPVIPFLYNFGDEEGAVKDKIIRYYEQKRDDIKRQVRDLRSQNQGAFR
jgi:spermidine synthase